MAGRIGRLSDRLLSMVVPATRASAMYCYMVGTGCNGCYGRLCCYPPDRPPSCGACRYVC